MRSWGVIRTAGGCALAAVAMVSLGSPAGADAPARVGWWSRVAPAPPPPDVPADGLHVSGGPGEPTAIAALVYQLADGAVATTLTLTLAGTSPRVDGLQACTVPLDAASFSPAQNGAWADRPAYDCEAGAVPVTVDGTTASFAVEALQQGDVLAIALVPGPTDRAAIEKPASSALTVTPPTAAAEAATTTDASFRPSSVADPSSVAAPSTASSTSSSLSSDLSMEDPSAATSDVSASPAATASTYTSAAAALTSVATDDEPRSWRTRVGGVLGFVLLLAALLFYSQGRGLLGARVGHV